jgi:hypothetical protein
VILVAAALLLGLGLALMRGGTLGALGRLTLRRAPLVLAALALQVLLFSGPASLRAALDPVFGPLYVGSFGLLLVALAANLVLPGMKAIVAGIGLNTLVIAANGGRMPSVVPDPSVGPLAAAATNTAVLSDVTALAFLADVLTLPAVLPGYAISVGDLLLVGGIAHLIRRSAAGVDGPAAPAPSSAHGSAAAS